MKHGKNPTRKQIEVIKARKLNPDNWLVVKDLPGELHIVHRVTPGRKIIKT